MAPPQSSPSSQQALEKALAETQSQAAYLRNLLDHVSAAISGFRVSANGHIQFEYWSAGCQAVFGYPAADLVANPQLWLSRIDPQDLATVVLPSFDRLPNQSSLAMEFRFHHSSGGWRWIAAQCAVQPDATATLICIEVSAYKQALAAIAACEKQFRTLFEQASVGIALATLDGILLRVNARCCAILDCSEAELLASGFPEFSNIEDVQHNLSCIEQLLAGEQSCFVTENSYRRKDGTNAWLKLTLSLVKELDTLPILVLVVVEDISERKQTEEVLRQYERIVASTPDGIALLDRDYTFRLINQTYLDWNDCRQEDIIGHKAADLMGAEVFEAIAKPELDRALSGEVVKYQAWFNYPQLGQQFVSVTYVPYVDPQGVIVGVVATSRNLTDLKRAEMALQQQAEREHLLALLTNRMRESLQLQTILDTTVLEVQQYLQADRVLVYRLESHGGRVIAESVSAPYPSLLGQRIDDPCLATAACRRAYQQGKIQNISAVAKASLPECYRAMLTRFRVAANLVLPILFADQIWGLLIAQQCSASRNWLFEEVDLLRQLTDQLSIAIQQAELYEQIQAANQQMQAANEQLQLANQKLEYLANHDPLTQVANRRFFNEVLEKEWGRISRDQGVISLIFCDVDYFKRYNDTYGHPAGDQCLAQVAMVLRESVQRSADLVSRYGGEEFVILLPNTDSQGAIQVVEQIQATMHSMNLHHRNSPISQQVTLSFGIAWGYPNGNYLPRNLMDAADQALYLAKQKSRNTYEIVGLAGD